ncbi:TonB-dependent receptor plug domain-containing protein [Winogradskyella haliclonae]|uniref:TonB-dependent receptor plug domain-containing protein n=1 Tax=Winogradskyella haliclonae TaxID=2048558 RepID=UPI001E2F1F8E|nr:TonB-dependent receptor [Winogradskyella haliclonae]
MNNFKSFLLILLFGVSLHGYAQTDNQKKPLSEILKQLEAKFDIRFSYADETVKTINLSFNDDLSLEEALLYLEEKTDLTFNRLNSRFISVEQRKPNYNSSHNNLQQLDEVFIQNYLTKGLAKTINGKIEITPQKFGILPGLSEPDILQTIQTLPGIISVDERISNINIRGGTNDQNLILYEGIRMYQTGHFFGLISAFNPYLTEKVDVTINGTRAKYGSGVSSAISIENSNEIGDKSESGAGFNLLSVDGFSKFQLSKKTELQLSARRSYTDALLTPTYDTYLERIFNTTQLENLYATPGSDLQQNERFFFYDASLKFLYDINKNSSIRANLLTIFNRLDYDIISPNDSLVTTESQLSQRSYAGNINYNYKWSESTNMSAQLSYSNYRLFGENALTTQELTQENEVVDVGARVDFLSVVDKNLNLNFGYQFNEVGVSNLEDVSNPRFRSFVKEVIRTQGIYTEAEFTSNSKNTYGRIGLRGNYLDKFSTVLFEPRFVFSQKFLNYFRLELLGEVKNQSINQIIDLQQDFFGIEKRRWQLANTSDVPILKSNQFSVGLNYKKKGWLISAEGYIKNVDGVSTRSQGFQNQFQLARAIGDYSIKGIDILFNKQFKNFGAWLSYSYSKNDYEFEFLNNNQAFPNNLDITHILNFSTTYEIENLKLSAGVNWHSGRPYTVPSMSQPNKDTIAFDTPNAERLPSYLRADVSARYSFQVADDVFGEVGASVLNLLDRENVINRFYTLNSNSQIIENNELALGLTPNFSLRLKF